MSDFTTTIFIILIPLVLFFLYVFIENQDKEDDKKKPMYAIIIITVIASIAFRFLGDFKLEQTSLLFIGIPALISLMIVRFVKKPKSAYGVAFLVITMFLLLCGILFGEGLICIIIMAPIFYGITAIVVFVYEYLKKRNKEKTYSFVIIPLLLVLFQPSEFFTQKKVHSIVTKQVVSEKNKLIDLNKTPDFMVNLPSFFKIGFPKPILSEGKGLKIGDTRTIYFKSSTKGIGELELEVSEVFENKIVFNIKNDDTHIHHWLSYKKIMVELNETKNGKEVTWTTDFTCDLGPSWYFEELEKYAIDLMNKHLINSYFTEKND